MKRSNTHIAMPGEDGTHLSEVRIADDNTVTFVEGNPPRSDTRYTVFYEGTEILGWFTVAEDGTVGVFQSAHDRRHPPDDDPTPIPRKPSTL